MSNNFLFLFSELFENEHVRIGQKGKLLIILTLIFENETVLSKCLYHIPSSEI